MKKMERLLEEIEASDGDGCGDDSRGRSASGKA
jgi:hypothetical protein